MKPDPEVIAEMVRDNSKAAGVLPRLEKEVEPVAYSNDPLIGLVGNVSRSPVSKPTIKGDVVAFGMAVKTGYDDDDAPRWIDVSVWNEGLQKYALQNFHKGAKIAVEGNYSTREYNEKTYEQITAQMVGLVEWGTRTKRPTAPVASASSSESEW